MTLPPSETNPLDLSCKQETTPELPFIKTNPITSDGEDVPDPDRGHSQFLSSNQQSGDHFCDQIQQPAKWRTRGKM